MMMVPVGHGLIEWPTTLIYIVQVCTFFACRQPTIRAVMTFFTTIDCYKVFIPVNADPLVSLHPFLIYELFHPGEVTLLSSGKASPPLSIWNRGLRFWRCRLWTQQLGTAPVRAGGQGIRSPSKNRNPLAHVQKQNQQSRLHVLYPGVNYQWWKPPHNGLFPVSLWQKSIFYKSFINKLSCVDVEEFLFYFPNHKMSLLCFCLWKHSWREQEHNRVLTVQVSIKYQETLTQSNNLYSSTAVTCKWDLFVVSWDSCKSCIMCELPLFREYTQIIDRACRIIRDCCAHSSSPAVKRNPLLQFEIISQISTLFCPPSLLGVWCKTKIVARLI